MKASRSQSRLWVIAGLAMGACLALWASAQPWFRKGHLSAAMVTGGELTGALAKNIPTVLLLCCVLLLLFGRATRRVLGMLAVVAGAWMAWLALTAQPRAAVDDVPISGTAASALSPITGWSYVYAGAAGLVVLAGAVLAIAPGQAAASQDVPEAADPDAWLVLDRGRDPTVG